MADIYVVRHGDTLSKIAKEFYGDATLWTFIHEANRHKIPNPDLIHVGQEIVIPDVEEGDDEAESYATLSQGSRGEQVTELQEALVELGYDIDVDGIFGAGTHKAVREFQAANGLHVDGIVGTHTWAALGFE
jgi:murein L,D-transpeptidase YcbB/YkuD